MLLQNNLFIKACHCEKVPRPPIWLMRQAGRYMPEYRALRKKYNFLQMCQTPELAAEITLQPIHRFGMDAAIIFSDILVTAQAMGGDLEFIEGTGPVFHNHIQNKQDIEELDISNTADKLDYVCKAIKLVKHNLAETPLIGFAGAPFTVAAYFLEGKLSKDLKVSKQLLYREPALAHLLLEKIAIVTIDYLNAQIRAGIDAIQIFESWAHVLSWDHFQTFSLHYIQKIIQGLHNPDNIPVIVFGRGSSVFAPLLCKSGASVLSFDWNSSLSDMRQIVPSHIAVQGNIDPYLLYASEKTITTEIHKLLKSVQNKKGIIINLGHGILLDMDPEKIGLLVELVKRV